MSKTEKESASKKIQRIYNALDYAKEGQDFKRTVSIIERILDGKTDEEIMTEDNNLSSLSPFARQKRNTKIQDIHPCFRPAINVLNNPAVPSDIEKKFRKDRLQWFAATEEALINRYLRGETELLPGKDFSESNLLLVKSIKDIKVR